MRAPPYPHRYPFRFVELRPPRRAVLRLTAAASPTAGGGAPPWLIGVEALAQATLLLLEPAGDEAPRQVALAGIDQASLQKELIHRPLTAGDTLIANLREGRRMGRLSKVHGWLEREGVTVIDADLILVFD